jgi:glucosamine-6-phosphate deaminase
MNVQIFDTYSDLSQRAADLVADLIRQLEQPVLGLPTGGTPEGFYAALVQRQADYERLTTFNLDEYVGLPKEHSQSYYSYMKARLFEHLPLDPWRIHLPNGEAADAEAECRRYEAEICAVGGIDLMILGLGHNGHIGFNEPGTPWESRTRRVGLTETTRLANARFFASLEQVPKEALTMGIGTILEARQIIVLASGESKAEIIRRTLVEEPTLAVPATSLRGHGNVTFLIDRAAAALLEPVVDI